MADATEGSPLIFNYNGFATEPYELRRLPFLPLYVGDALLFWGPRSTDIALSVPANTVAVVTLHNGQIVLLPGGRHELARAAPHPLSVQFVSLRLHSFEFKEVEVHTIEHMLLDLDLRISVQVISERAEQITRWQDPEADIKAAMMEVLVEELGKLPHDECHKRLPSMLQGYLRTKIVERFEDKGLKVIALNLMHFHPDKEFISLARKTELEKRQHELSAQKQEQDHQLEDQKNQQEHDEQMEQFLREKAQLAEREKLSPYRRYVEQIEAQAKEDVFAIQQPGFRRGALTDINKQLREFNQNARMEAIKAVGEVVKALVEDLHRHPGLRAPGEIENLEKAMALLEKLSAPDFIKAPPIPQQVRSDYAIDPNQPVPPKYERPENAGGNGHH